MNNIKKIDGVRINLNLVVSPDVSRNVNFNEKTLEKVFAEGFRINFYCSGGRIINAKTIYKTKEQAEKRIDEILSKQNSKEIEI